MKYTGSTGMASRRCGARAGVFRACCAAGAALLALLPGGRAAAGTIRLEPSAGLSESYTDNVRGVRSGEEADWITESSAGGRLTANGNRLNLNLNMNAAHETHLNTKGIDGFRPSILGAGDVELLEDRLFIEGAVSLSEVTASRSGPVSATQRNLPSNKRQLMTYSFDPRLEYRFARMAEATLRYSYSETLVSQPGAGTGVTAGAGFAAGSTGDSKTESISLELGTGPRFGRLDSQLVLRSEADQSAGRGETTEDRAELINEYQLSRQFALIFRGGYEDIGDPNPGLTSSGATGAIGFRLKPGPKLDLRMEKGRRFQGSNLEIEARYQITPSYKMTASFTQSVETQQSSRLNRLRGLVADPVTGELIDPVTGNPADPNSTGFTLDNGSFQQDLARFGLSGVRGRNSVNFGADYTSQDFKTGNTSEDQFDVNLNIRRKMRRNLTGSLGLGYSDILQSRTPGTAETTYDGSARLDYVLGKSLTSSLEYTRLLRTPESNITDALSEDIVTIGVRANF